MRSLCLIIWENLTPSPSSRRDLLASRRRAPACAQSIRSSLLCPGHHSVFRRQLWTAGWGVPASSFLASVVSMGLPPQNCAHWFWALGLLLDLGFLWDRSLFPNSHSGPEGADSQTHKPLTSAFSHGLPTRFPYSLAHKGTVWLWSVLVGLQMGWGWARARIGESERWGVQEAVMSWRNFFHSLCSLVFPSARG